MSKTDSEYRTAMDGPMEELASSMQPNKSLNSATDAEIVELAAKKIRTLRAVLGSVLTQEIIDAIMKE